MPTAFLPCSLAAGVVRLLLTSILADQGHCATGHFASGCQTGRGAPYGGAHDRVSGDAALPSALGRRRFPALKLRLPLGGLSCATRGRAANTALGRGSLACAQLAPLRGFVGFVGFVIGRARRRAGQPRRVR